MTRNLQNLLALAMLVSAASAQITLVGAGHTNPAPIQIAPGEVTTLFVSGVSTRFPSPVTAPPPPLPVILGGISIRIQQGANTYPVPLFSINQTNTCSTAATSQCFMTGITVQIPFELDLSPNGLQNPTMIVSVNGVDSQSSPLTLVAQDIHILTSCDSIFVPALTGHLTCGPLITHADGSAAVFDVPANGNHNGYVNRVFVSSGETIVIYATGLGSPLSKVTTGAATPSPAPRVSFSLNNVTFVTSPDAGATPPVDLCSTFGVCPAAPPGQPAASAWLVPGYVGLYQINVALPRYTAAEVSQYCSTPTATQVVSNVTISLFENGSLTSLGVCMQASPLIAP